MKTTFVAGIFALSAFTVNGKGPFSSADGGNNGTVSAVTAIPLSFIENKMQVTDQRHNPRPDIQFHVAAAAGLNIFIGNGAIHYQFSKCNDCISETAAKNSDLRIPSSEQKTWLMYRMDVELICANKNARVVKEEKMNYSEHRRACDNDESSTTACAFNKITYKNIYPHIDWVLSITDGKLQQEFVVRKGGKASDIRLKYGGTTTLKLQDDGSLYAATPQGSITEHPPVTWEKDGKKVSSSFSLNNDVLSYNIGTYTGDLIIDPTLMWATYYGGSSTDEALGTATDNAGNVYIAGYTTSISSIATSGAYRTTFGGAYDAFLAKLNSSGSIQWATYYGDAGSDAADAIAIDGSGNVYIAGSTTSTSGIATPGAYQTANAGGAYDAFLAKFNGSGTLQWATYFGGSDDDRGYGVATDGTGDVYITGTTASSSGIATPGAYQASRSGSADGFLAKFNGAGTIQWATYFGGSDYDWGVGVATDGSGNVYMAGPTGSSSAIATPGAYQASLSGTSDAFLAKFNGSGAIQWATYYGGTAGDNANAVAIDGTGNIFITGATSSASGVATTGAYQSAYGGGDDAFVAKFNGSGTVQWATYYGGTGTESGQGVATDGRGNVYITGYTSSTSGVTTSGAYQGTYGGGIADAFLAIFNNAGSIQWATYYGGSTDDLAFSAATDGAGNVYTAGYTTSTSAIASPGAYQPAYGGGSSDGFLAKFNFFVPSSVNWTPSLSDQINLLPNPTQSNITISSRENIKTVIVNNLLGQRVFSGEYDTREAVINLSQLPDGMYIVQVNASQVFKVMKQQ